MIVLDENLDQQRVRLPLQSRYRGNVLTIRDLRRGTVIKDDAVPEILRLQNKPTFVTTNAVDFWRKVPAHARYCIICVPLPTERQDEIPELLCRFLRHKDFRTIRLRMGKVIRVSWSGIRYYQAGKIGATELIW